MASMNVREWASNLTQFLKTIPETDRANSSCVSVLGYPWNCRSDKLSIASFQACKTLVTKRSILKFIASIYDPLGLYCPAILPAKVFMQKLWVLRVDWDENLAPDMYTEWNEICMNIMPLTTLSFPRFVGINAGDVTYELHCFCDASQKAYGVCIYLCKKSLAGNSCDLLFAKARVAPLNAISLPRLELISVFIGRKCLEFVEKSLPFIVIKKFIWSDSQCVLHWLNTKNPLPVFVKNRIIAIKNYKHVEFRYVPTEENPADMGSRGKSANDIATSSLWWHGPPWITLDEKSWPPMNFLAPLDVGVPGEILPKDKNYVLLEVAANAENRDTPLINIERFSSLTKLLKVTAWCIHFINRLKKKIALTASLTAEELKEAKLYWITFIQKTHFKDVLLAMHQNKRHPLQTELDLWLDLHGILRCKGRLINADIDYDAVFPKLLPKKSHFTKLVIKNFHEKLFHTGVAHTLSQIRQEYWIPGGRSEVFKYIRSCIQCRRVDGGPYKPPLMPPLPKSRVQSSAPFTFTGLDYLGPLYVKTNENTLVKTWICLFSCMATRAVHLELTEDMTASQFLLALKRFIARRGKPSCIISDNATQFKLANFTMNKLWKTVVVDKNIQSYTSDANIKWSFIVEKAPWMGGFYERMVQLVKRALRKSIYYVHLTFVQLQTVVSEIEAMINSRPLVYVGSDLSIGLTLTPAHFLSLNPKIGLPDADTNDQFDDPESTKCLSSRLALLQAWKKGERHLQTFWKVWKNDYLLSLRERTQTQLKCARKAINRIPKIGDIVHIKSNAPRGSWLLARITELSKGTDGQIRSVRVILPSGKLFTRSIVHLFPLEVNDDLDENPSLQLTDSILDNGHNMASVTNSQRRVISDPHLDEETVE